jgi:hypothetical protein
VTASDFIDRIVVKRQLRLAAVAKIGHDLNSRHCRLVDVDVAFDGMFSSPKV